MPYLNRPFAPGCPGTEVVPLRTWLGSAFTTKTLSKEKTLSSLQFLSQVGTATAVVTRRAMNAVEKCILKIERWSGWIGSECLLVGLKALLEADNEMLEGNPQLYLYLLSASFMVLSVPVPFY
jgi:hypothetical protein